MLDSARLILSDRSFRIDLILGHRRPSGYPEQLKERFDLSPLELATVCIFAFRLMRDEIMGIGSSIPFVVNPSSDFLEALRRSGTDAETLENLTDKIEQMLGVNLRK